MDNSKICIPRVLKNVAYVIAPIILIVLIFVIACLSYPMEREAINNKENFIETNIFAEKYASEIFNAFSSVKHFEQNNYDSSSLPFFTYETEVNDNKNIKKIYYITDYYGSNVRWLIINKETKTAYTNIEYSLGTSTFDDVKNQVLSEGKYWNYNNSKLDTTINKLKNVEYVDIRLSQNSEDANNYTIYTSLLDPLEAPDSIYQAKVLYNILLVISPNAMYLIPILVIILIILVPIVVIGIGKKRGHAEIVLNWFDKILIELACFIDLFIGSIGMVFIAVVSDTRDMLTFILAITSIGIGFLIIYLACIHFFETVVKRIKTHTFIKTTFIYWIYKKAKALSKNIKLNNHFIAYFILYIMINILSVLLVFGTPLLGIALFVGFNTWTGMTLVKKIESNTNVKKAIHELYDGKTDINLNENDFCNEDRKVAKEINDIAGGLSNAIEERLKSERLKTELITNVSHDIKTPLTSIINYVDLLKKENIENEKALEYLNILDNKSQRLKKLTDDLVEASKASSGAIKLNKERLNVNELIKQVSGEFEDRFKEHNLEEIISFTKNDIYIDADSRYLFRILENMYSNIAKYAMEGTRVYVDIEDKNDRVYIKLKNVSKQKLNISVDELMQRFVRGEASRNTEGSGLGLSIAKSLTELQNGKFNIYLDGDLFKVTIEFNKIK